jgi:glycosyltransferase involved in cell wall biosynthesis
MSHEANLESSSRRFVIITPCRNEAAHLPVTIRTMAVQTLLPKQWIIVDDGSTDCTADILAKAMRQYKFIKVVRRDDRGKRSVGPGVIDAFNAGLDSIEDLDGEFDYLCKLDADLEIPPRYFERLVQEMEAEPSLGTVSGKVYIRRKNGGLSHERRGDENSVGPAKFYRVACYRDIGGFARSVGWDGIDGHMCRLKGWLARSFDEPDYRLVHRRMVGSSDRNVLVGRLRGGEGKWVIGMPWWYILVAAIYRCTDRPYVIGSLLMVWGYFLAMFRRVPQFGDQEYHRYLRSYLLDALVRGKSKATQMRHDAIRASRNVTSEH